jgi:hypothetical protein
MQRSDLRELYYFAPIENINSICKLGILSHARAAKVKHKSVAMEVIQDRRARKLVPGGRSLHQYANLYINARNKALYKLKCQLRDQIAALGVLRISLDVLDLPYVVIVDQNASSNWARFLPSPEGLRNLEYDRVFAESWIHDNPIETMIHGSIVCAEVLVPDRVDAQFVTGVYVPNRDSEQKCRLNGVTIPISVNSHLFFLD